MEKNLQAEAQAHQDRLDKAQAELNAWKQDPITIQFLTALRLWQESIKSQWARGVFNGETLEATALANHKAASEYGILEQVLNLDAEEIEGILQNDNE
jgi:hypothetical protein